MRTVLFFNAKRLIQKMVGIICEVEGSKENWKLERNAKERGVYIIHVFWDKDNITLIKSVLPITVTHNSIRNYILY